MMNEWISVEDQLPGLNKTVIVDGGIAYLAHDRNWYTLTGEEYPGKVIQWTVTHWMPLPEPPEQS